jgi:phage-related minor tail protein
MSSTSQEIKVVLSADPSQLQAGAAKGEQALVKFVNAAKATTGGLNGVGTASVSTTRAMAMLSPQITDIVTSLQGGQNPLTVFIQQGGQIKDVFGGIGPALRGIGSLITPLAVGFTVAAAAGGSFVYALYQASEQAAKFRDINALTGASLGLTEGAFRAVIEAAANSSRSSLGSAREMAEAYAQSGRISGDSLQLITDASLRLAKRSGQTSESVVSDMLAMQTGVADWATKHNQSWHFMTAAQIEYVRQLEESGQQSQAMGVVLTSLNEHLGTSATLWDRAKNAASGAWAAFADSLRADTAIERLARLQKQLVEVRGATGAAPALGMDYGEYQNRLDLAKRLEQQIADQSIDLRDGTQRAANRAVFARDEEARIVRLDKLRVVTERLSGASSEYSKTIKTIQDAYKAGDISEAERLRLLTETATLYSKPGPKAKTAEELKAKEERKYRAMVDATLKNRPTSLAEIEAKGYEDANRAATENMTATAENYRKRNAQAAEYQFQLLDQTEQINISLIADDHARGEAQIELDRDVMQHRLDLLAKQGADVTAAQEQLNLNIIARQRALNEQLKPEYAKNLEAWQDSQRLMYDSTNNLQSAWLRDGEDAWVKFAQTGKLSVRSLVDDVLAEMARLQFKQTIAGGLSNFLGTLISAYVGGGSGITNDSTGSLVDNGLGAGRALGGPIYPRTLHPINENGEPELVSTPKGTYLATGNQAGHVTPLRALGSGGGQGGSAPVVNLHIEGAPSTPEVTQQSNGQGGVDLMVRFVAAAKAEVAKDIQAGGSVSRAMASNFGLRRATPARA